jgi:hypothetical protein
MNEQPNRKRYPLYENFILAWDKIGKIRKIVERLMGRKSFKDLPETVKDDIKEINDTIKETPKE